VTEVCPTKASNWAEVTAEVVDLYILIVG